MDISSLTNQMLVLIILLFLGFVAFKAGVMTANSNKGLSRIVLILAQSAMILSSVMNAEISLDARGVFTVIGITCAMYAILFLLSLLCSRILRAPKSDRGTYEFMAMFGNVGFMGYPVIASLFGAEAVFYTSLFNIPFNILVYSLGIVQLSGGDRKRFRLKQIITAPLVATFIAIIIFSTGLHIPTPIASATKLLGDMTVPAAMLIIGCSLGDIPIKELFGKWQVYVFTALKLLVIPIIVWAILRLFVTDPLLLGIATVISSLPVATTSTMLCMEHDGNVALASRTVFITTVASVVTIPAIVYLLLL